jgi:hypothetical protein
MVAGVSSQSERWVEPRETHTAKIESIGIAELIIGRAFSRPLAPPVLRSLRPPAQRAAQHTLRIGLCVGDLRQTMRWSGLTSNIPLPVDALKPGSLSASTSSGTASGKFAAKRYSAAWRTWRALGVRMVTSSSAAVGCSAMVASKSALVAFILTAMPSS